MPLTGILAAHLSAQSLSFSRSFGGKNYDDARCVVAMPDGGLAFTGLTKSGPDSLGTMFLTKVNTAGAPVWTKYFDREREDGGNHLIATLDGGYLISGHTALSYGSLCDGFLAKTDANGNELWRALVGGTDDDVCNGAVELGDGSFAVTGRTEDAATRTFRVLFARIAADGKQVFLKQVGGDQPCMAYKIAKSADGNLLFAGYDYFNDGRADQFMLTKCSPNGAVLWHTAVENPLGTRAFQVVPLPDGGGIAIGGRHDGAGLPEKACLVRFDADGKILKQKTFEELPGKACAFDGALLADGSFAATGVDISADGQTESPFLMHFSGGLELLGFQKTSTENARARSLAICPDGNIVLAGLLKTDGGQTDIFLEKLAGFSGNAALVDVEKMPFLLFPNPIEELAYLKIGHGNEPKTLTLFTADGHQVRQDQFDAAEFFIEKKGLPTGLLFFTIKNAVGETMKTGRILIAD